MTKEHGLIGMKWFFQIMTGSLILSFAFSAHTEEDWKMWMDRRAVEIEQEKKSNHIVTCAKIGIQFNSAMSRLRTDWNISGPSTTTLSSALNARRVAGQGLTHDCADVPYSKSWQELRDFERMLEKELKVSE